MDWFWNLIDAGRRLAPHGYCLMWEPGLIWTHVVSDAVIAAAYFSIPVALIRFVRRRRDLEFSWIFWLFATFIVACGTTHLMAIWTLWHADYGWEGMVKAVTAISSIGTAIVLWPLIPKLLLIPSPLQLRQRNDELAGALERLTHEMAERRRAEEALRQAQKMEAVGQLTGGIAHDFNNLLQSMTGMLELIARNPASAQVAKWADLGRRAAERGARLTGQLLAFSRTQRMELRPCAVAPLVRDMRDLLGSSLGPSVELVLDLERAEGVQVLGDPTQIELAVMNLAINARDAMPGGGRITVRAEPVALAGDAELQDGDYLGLEVSDSGVGMTKEVAAKAFEPFFTTKGVGKGTGLGLSMVYGVARQAGGRAEIVSAPGEGTKVSMLFKVIQAAGEEQEESRRGAAPAGPARVLVVDDDEDVRLVSVSMLEMLGHEVVEAASGEAALLVIASAPPDLVLMDFAMPLLDGAETARRARDAGYCGPIVFATGFADSDAVAAAVGPDAAMLRKPFALDALAAAVAEALAEKP